MKNKFPPLLFFIMCFIHNVYAQDIHFSQIGETPLLRNPALAGLFNGDVRVQNIYRSQWNSFTDAYQTVSSNLEFKIPVGQGDDYATLGAQVCMTVQALRPSHLHIFYQCSITINHCLQNAVCICH